MHLRFGRVGGEIESEIGSIESVCVKCRVSKLRKLFALTNAKPLPGLGPTGALEAGGWQEASVWTRYRAKDPRQNSNICSGFRQARCLGKVLSSGVQAPPVVAESHHGGREISQLGESF